MVRKSILGSQRQTIETCIVSIPPASVHIMRGEHDLFLQEPVVSHEQCSVKQLELVVPQNVKDSRPG